MNQNPNETQTENYQPGVNIEKTSNLKKWLPVTLVVLVVLVIGAYFFNQTNKSADVIEVGVVTPLTGDVAYWGQSSIQGAELAKQDLKDKGINIRFVVEDGQLNPQLALSAVQKLINVDNVQAVYSEFAPAAISVSSFLKDKDVIHIYNAAVTSPLLESENNYKTYIDFNESCKNVASYLKDKGINKVGILKVNAEFAELCKEGIEEIYPNSIKESFNFGEKDFRTIVLKMKNQNVEAIFNPSLIAEAQLGLIEVRKQGLDIPYIVAYDALLPSFIEENSTIMNKVMTFGFPNVSKEFLSRLSETIPAPEAAAVTYTHLMQLGEAINRCGNDVKCVKGSLDTSDMRDEISFKGFNNRIAEFDLPIREWSGSEFVEVSD